MAESRSFHVFYDFKVRFFHQKSCFLPGPKSIYAFSLCYRGLSSESGACGRNQGEEEDHRRENNSTLVNIESLLVYTLSHLENDRKTLVIAHETCTSSHAFKMEHRD